MHKYTQLYLACIQCSISCTSRQLNVQVQDTSYSWHWLAGEQAGREKAKSHKAGIEGQTEDSETMTKSDLQH